jgi:hypothetical protein
MAGFGPVPRMVHNAGTDHVEVDIYEATREMIVSVDRCRVVYRRT